MPVAAVAVAVLAARVIAAVRDEAAAAKTLEEHVPALLLFGAVADVLALLAVVGVAVVVDSEGLQPTRLVRMVVLVAGFLLFEGERQGLIQTAPGQRAVLKRRDLVRPSQYSEEAVEVSNLHFLVVAAAAGSESLCCWRRTPAPLLTATSLRYLYYLGCLRRF